MRALMIAAVFAVCAAGCRVVEVDNRGEEVVRDADGKPVTLADGTIQKINKGWNVYHNQHWMTTKMDTMTATVKAGEINFALNGLNSEPSTNLVALVDTSLSGAAMLATKIGAAIVTAGGSPAAEGTGAAIGALVEKFLTSGGDASKATVEVKDGGVTVTDGAVTCTDGACYAK